MGIFCGTIVFCLAVSVFLWVFEHLAGLGGALIGLTLQTVWFFGCLTAAWNWADRAYRRRIARRSTDRW